MERSDDVLIGGQTSSSASGLNGDINSVLNTNSLNSSSNGTNSNVNGGLMNSNGGVTGAQGGNSDRPANSYTMPGILHYLQHEWNRFEFERQQWEVDRSELLVSCCFGLFYFRKKFIFFVFY
jgi:hypothetical protein